jgi:urea ABC transporter urea binding protein
MPEITLGILHSLTGTMGVSERPLVEAALTAIDEINEGGGVLDHLIHAIVEDGASDPAVFARSANKLIRQDHADALFGCWTSASRKAVKVVVEELHSLLWYPVQYEGLEESTHIIYTGSCLNQQIVPAVRWLLTAGKQRCLIVGSDYVFPRTANRLIGALLKENGSTVVGDLYFPLGCSDFSGLVAQLPALKPDCIFNTLNGESNIAFFRQLYAAGVRANDIKCISFSVSEREQAQFAHEAVGHYTCWSYYQTLETQANRAFVQHYKQRCGEAATTSDPIMSAYIQPFLWKQAVEKAQSFISDEVRKCLVGCQIHGPGGIVKIQANNHVEKQVLIGRARADGLFDIVWHSEGLVAPKPWLGVEDLTLAGKELMKEAMGQFTQMMFYANQLESEIVNRREVEARLGLAMSAGHFTPWEYNIRDSRIQTFTFFEQILGYSPGELSDTRESWKSVIHKDDWVMVNEAFRVYIEKGEGEIKLQFRALTRDNRERWITLIGMITDRDGSGRPLKITGMQHDITEKKRSEEIIAEKIRELEEFNRLAVDRELRMIELKKQINDLLIRLGEDEKYEIAS